jgi:hypothetical protein
MPSKSYDYVRRGYGVDPVVGARVRHTVTLQFGEIARESRSQAHYVMVRFDGRTWAAPCHPTELDYNPAEVEG